LPRAAQESLRADRERERFRQLECPLASIFRVSDALA
jgi:hypothetical protein